MPELKEIMNSITHHESQSEILKIQLQNCYEFAYKTFTSNDMSRKIKSVTSKNTTLNYVFQSNIFKPFPPQKLQIMNDVMLQ